MTSEENVDVETTRTGEEVSVEKGAKEPPKEAPTVLGKFKDVDALASAYEALQAEFTRRSQRLRQLEKQAENFKASSENASGAEKLRKTASARREEAKKFDEFVAEVGTPSAAKKKPVGLDEAAALAQNTSELTRTVGFATSEAPVEGGERANSGAEREETIDLSAKENAGEVPLEELYRRASENDEVRLRIVGEYLSSLGKTGAPLTANGAGVLTAPTAKAKTVGEAGNMALRYFRKPLA